MEVVEGYRKNHSEKRKKLNIKSRGSHVTVGSAHHLHSRLMTVCSFVLYSTRRAHVKYCTIDGKATAGLRISIY